MEIRKLVLITAFRLSTAWDLITTFLGMLIILGNIGFISLGISVVGTLVAGAFNFSTKVIWDQRAFRNSDLLIQVIVLRLIWLLAVIFDFFTSLTCNAMYIAFQKFEITGNGATLRDSFQNLTLGQALIVLFVTSLTVISPMMVGYIKDWDMDFFG